MGGHNKKGICSRDDGPKRYRVSSRLSKRRLLKSFPNSKKIKKGSLEIGFGPMCSGKTTLLISRLTRFADLGFKCAYINSKKDTRTETEFSTHSTFTRGSENIAYFKVSSLEEVDVTPFRLIGVDEQHMYSDLKKTVLHWVLNLHKDVVVVGLDGDFNAKPIGEIFSLIPYSNKCEKISAFCLDCSEQGRTEDAPFTICTDPEVYGGDKKINVGGVGKYIPVCAHHREKYVASYCEELRPTSSINITEYDEKVSETLSNEQQSFEDMDEVPISPLPNVLTADL